MHEKRLTNAFNVSYNYDLRVDVWVHKLHIYRNAKLYTFSSLHGHTALLPTLQSQFLIELY
jgi:hypothetical protein